MTDRYKTHDAQRTERTAAPAEVTWVSSDGAAPLTWVSGDDREELSWSGKREPQQR